MSKKSSEPSVTLPLDKIDVSLITISDNVVEEGNGCKFSPMYYMINGKRHILRPFMDVLEWRTGIELGYQDTTKPKEEWNPDWKRGWSMMFCHPTKRVFLVDGEFQGLDPVEDAKYLKTFKKIYEIENRVNQLLVEKKIFKGEDGWETRMIRFNSKDNSVSVSFKLAGQPDTKTKTWTSYTKLYVRAEPEPIFLTVEQARDMGTYGMGAVVLWELQGFAKSKGQSVVRQPAKEIDIRKWGSTEKPVMVSDLLEAQGDAGVTYDAADVLRQKLMEKAKQMAAPTSTDFNVIDTAELEAMRKLEESGPPKKKAREESEDEKQARLMESGITIPTNENEPLINFPNA